MLDREREALLALTLVPGLGPILTGRCVDAFGSAEAALGAGVDDLAQVKGIGRKVAMKLRIELDRLADGAALAEELERMEEHGVRLLVSSENGFPATLRHIPGVPPLLYMRGDLSDEDTIAVAIVGSRRCTHYGRQQADRLASLCVQAGLCIVSGGAYGIDIAAHRAAIRSGGRTISVLGSGLGRLYPQEHRALFDEIADGHGALLSELPMTAPPLADNFPRRNRIISGLSLGVLVVEAAQRSGALLTARLAAEDHGREVMAVPGRIDSPASSGCHKMIREGWASLVTNIADILDVLGETGQLLRAGVDQGVLWRDGSGVFEQNLSESQQRIVASLDSPQALDQISAATGLSVQAIQSDLTLLEIRGLIEKSGASFSRSR